MRRKITNRMFLNHTTSNNKCHSLKQWWCIPACVEFGFSNEGSVCDFSLHRKILSKIFHCDFNFRASSADMAAAAKGNEPDERNIMDGGDDWGSHPWAGQLVLRMQTTKLDFRYGDLIRRTSLGTSNTQCNFVKLTSVESPVDRNI